MADEPDPLAWLEASIRQPSRSRADFQAQLLASDRTLIGLARQVASAIEPVTSAFLQADAHGAATAETVDAEVDRRSRDLEESCYILLARQAPVGGDLRRIVGVVRSAGWVQRSANLLGHVAASLRWMHPPALPDEVRQMIAQLGEVAADIMNSAADAWEAHDGLAAVDLESRDDQADLLQKCLLTELYTGHQSVEEAVSLALLARYYERIADHGVEVARQVAYVITGERVE